MSSTRSIRALLRGLEVLHVLNRHNGATVSEVASEIDLPRTTTYRILETLCVAGYAYRATSDDRYRLTIMVRGLSEGFDDEAWVTLIARQHLYSLCNDVVWPCAILTLSGNSMLVRQTTDHKSPLAVEKRGPGFRVQILGSASGMCYLSFCPKEQRDALLDLLTKSKQSENQALINKKQIYETLVETRKQGYGIWHRKRRISDETSLAVPIFADNRLLASLAMRFASTAISQKEAISRFVPQLHKAAQDIADEFMDQSEEKTININSKSRSNQRAVIQGVI
ncbi:MAG: helix-turn-helix domain-containing protein [Pseudomonadota bacterium]|nr:helix-turn-helix domain-containing protein [Pseudomonadota bacterium]